MEKKQISEFGCGWLEDKNELLLHDWANFFKFSPNFFKKSLNNDYVCMSFWEKHLLSASWCSWSILLQQKLPSFNFTIVLTQQRKNVETNVSTVKSNTIVSFLKEEPQFVYAYQVRGLAPMEVRRDDFLLWTSPLLLWCPFAPLRPEWRW